MILSWMSYIEVGFCAPSSQAADVGEGRSICGVRGVWGRGLRRLELCVQEGCVDRVQNKVTILVS